MLNNKSDSKDFLSKKQLLYEAPLVFFQLTLDIGSTIIATR